MGHPTVGRFLYDTPATYQIYVQGQIMASWADRLQGMTISAVSRPDAAPVTLLMGELFDQASLIGVLNALYDLRVTLLLINRLGEVPEAILREIDLHRAE